MEKKNQQNQSQFFEKIKFLYKLRKKEEKKYQHQKQKRHQYRFQRYLKNKAIL